MYLRGADVQVVDRPAQQLPHPPESADLLLLRQEGKQVVELVEGVPTRDAAAAVAGVLEQVVDERCRTHGSAGRVSVDRLGEVRVGDGARLPAPLHWPSRRLASACEGGLIRSCTPRVSLTQWTVIAAEEARQLGRAVDMRKSQPKVADGIHAVDLGVNEPSSRLPCRARTIQSSDGTTPPSTLPTQGSKVPFQ